MRRRKWSRSVGDRPHRVRVFERKPGGPLYLEWWDPTLRGGIGDKKRVSFGHRDREAAHAFAADFHAKLVKGVESIRAGRLTLARLFALYFELRTPQKSATEQKADERRIKLFLAFLGRDKDPAKITRTEWERFIALRRAGELGGDGRPVRNRTIEADLRWLIAVLNWGHHHEDRDGRRLLESNPVAGYELPHEKNPRRPVATQEQYAALRAVSDAVKMELRDRARRVPVRSYLSEILDLAHWTGRPGIGTRYLFPAPGDPEKPVHRNLADAWLHEAARLAELELPKGWGWHAFRRKAATELKHAPDKDVMRLLGWSDPRSLKMAYQHADDATTLAALESRREYRELAL